MRSSKSLFLISGESERGSMRNCPYPPESEEEGTSVCDPLPPSVTQPGKPWIGPGVPTRPAPVQREFSGVVGPGAPLRTAVPFPIICKITLIDGCDPCSSRSAPTQGQRKSLPAPHLAMLSAWAERRARCASSAPRTGSASSGLLLVDDRGVPM